MHGKIVKGIAGFYYVHVAESGIYECKAKGIFRKDKKKPLVGDDVELDVLDETGKKGNIIRMLPRKNQLIRPEVANVDQALVIFAMRKPQPNLGLLDRFLIMMQRQQTDTVICFNKKDLASLEEQARLEEIYGKSGCRLLFLSAQTEEGLDRLRALLDGKTTAVAGPSGVGKSSLINLLQPEARMETGKISEKIDRGKHTTRHSELIAVASGTYIMDTPGFSSLYLEGMEKEELKNFFPEFAEYEPFCRFGGCMHIHEPDCGVKQALGERRFSRDRYDSYLELYGELKEKRRYGR
ncbi:ribosome small subunit-dependent GTPase A [Lachnospiraceae bacterium 46-15]